MLLSKLILKYALLASMLLSGALTGCARTVILYPIEQTDIYEAENGDICMSEFYLNDVLKVKLEEK